MKKVLKAAISLLMCLAILLPILTACGGGNDLGNVVYGRYVEEDITPEGMIGLPRSLVSFSDGTLDVITTDWGNAENNYMSSYYRWRSTDGGKTWQQMDMSWTKEYINDYSEYYDKGETPQEEVYLSSFVPCENGDILYQVYRYTYDAETQIYTNSSEINRISADGTKTPFIPGGMDEAAAEAANISIDTMTALPQGKLYLRLYIEPTEEQMNDPNFNWDSTSQSAVYDMNSGEKLYDLNFTGWEVFYNDTTLFLNNYDEGFTAVNLADGTPSTAPMPDNDKLQMFTQNSYMGNAFVDNSNSFYKVSARGMEKLTTESEETEQVMDGINYTFGSPLFSISGTIYNPEDETFIMSVYETTNSAASTGKVLRYVWDDEAIASSDNKITVYSLYENYSVRLALSQFKRENPDVTVQYETGFEYDPNSYYMEESDDANALTEEDVLRALNTELLNGTGPDVLILDGLPVESFVSKGVLEDLSEVLAAQEGLYQPLFDPMYQDGIIYAVPTNFLLPALFGDKGYVEQFNSLDVLRDAIQSGPDLPAFQEYNPEWTPEEEEAYYQSMYGAKPAEEQPTMYFDSLEDVFNTFYSSCAPDIFSESGGINQQNLAAFLEMIKAVSDKCHLSDPEYVSYGGGYSAISTGYATYEISQSLSRYTNRQSRLGYQKLGSFQILTQVAYSLHWSAQPTTYGKSVDEDGNIIEADETEQETLPDVFPNVVIAPGFSTGVYYPTQMVGVTSTSERPELARSFVATMLSDDVQKYDMSNGFPVTKSAFEYQYKNYMETDAAYMREQGVELIPFDYEAIISNVTTPFYQNDFLRSSIMGPAQEYCAGTISLDEATNQIVSETEMYFSERQ